MTPSQHTLDRLDVAFDAKGLVANAGLLLPATLAHNLGLPQLFEAHIDLGKVPGAANPGRKAMTMVLSLLAGGQWITDADALRSGDCGGVLGITPAAATSVGTFLRAVTSGHARQFDAAQEDLHQRAWDASAGPTAMLLKLDLDSTVIETYGLKKQGGKGFTYLNTRGYHPLLAVLAESGEVIHSRLREGRATSGRGAGNFARQALARLGRLGAGYVIVVRADSGFYAEKVVAACQAHDARFSISVRLQKSHHELIAAIPEEQWTPIPYWREGAADVAEIPYRPFGKKQTYRMIVRRVEPTPGSQLYLKGVLYSYYAFITDREGNMLELDADHRQHAVVEDVIRDLKHGLALNHMPSGKFGANAAWLALNVIAHNLCRWMGRLGEHATACLETWRRRFISVPARLIVHGGRRRLRLPAHWPWQHQFLALLARLRAVALPATLA